MQQVSIRFFTMVVAMGAIGACTSTSTVSSKSAQDASLQSALEKGTKVCISEVAGVRYDLEEAMRERDLTPEYSCVSADVQVEERGEPRAWVMRYQRIGDAKWRECRSSQEERFDFADRCLGEMISKLGGG